MTFPLQLDQCFQLPCLGRFGPLWQRLFIMLVVLSALAGPQHLAHGQSREYAIKAAFLFHFTQFVEWPSEAFAETNSPFVIAIVGADPFGKVLDDLIHDEKAKGRTIVAKRYKAVNEVDSCHILYVCQSEESNMDRIIKYMHGKPVLTVSDMEAFVFRGGMIRFITDKNKIRFRINNDVARREGLTISSKLLRLAELVPAQ